jgi:1-acyl-sn-glycerol-3-phosphate acyltransferase
MARKEKRLLPQKAGAGFLRGASIGVFRPLLKHYGHPEVLGLENLAAQSPPLILAANHSSMMDTPLLLASMPRELRHKTVVAAASDYFFSSRWRGLFVSAALGAVPMERQATSTRTLDAVTQLLAEKWCLIIYPEGSRTLDGRLYRGKTGIARLALAARAPIVPVGITGTYDCMPSGRGWPVPGHVQVRFGKPLTFDRYLLGVADQLVLRAITDQVMYEIMMLSGQTYIDEYVTSAKRRRQRSDSQAGQEANDEAAPDEAEGTPGDMSDQDTSLCTGPRRGPDADLGRPRGRRDGPADREGRPGQRGHGRDEHGGVFAMPCRTGSGGLDVEGLGIVYLEASATGLPVIGGDSAGATRAGPGSSATGPGIWPRPGCAPCWSNLRPTSRAPRCPGRTPWPARNGGCPAWRTGVRLPG